MCTAIKYISQDFYFGRTLDNDVAYNEEIVITPRNFKISMRSTDDVVTHHAVIGVATVMKGFPLYYDACNERGLAMAGLNFVGNACYNDVVKGKNNVASFELIPYLLGVCSSVDEVKKALKDINVTNVAFDPALATGQLHWMVADKKAAIVIECEKDGMRVYDNDAGTLTNNPPFPMQRFALNNYVNLSAKPTLGAFSEKITLDQYSRGMGAMGLPGDLSSQSRFVRAAFTLLNAATYDNEEQSVNQFFHILGAVDQTDGCCMLTNGLYETTIYTSCCNADKGIYYYTTYNNRTINGVDMRKTNLDAADLVRFPMIKRGRVNMQN